MTPPRVEREMVWKCRDSTLSFASGPLLMGILNVTPDSFSDGGRHFNPDAAVARGLQMAGEGAAIIDVGGESTRPGAPAVPEEEERRRVVPVVERLARELAGGGALVSVDTMKARVAECAVAAGASIINDVSALTFDPRMAEVARESGAGVVLMHMRGNPRTMQDDPCYKDVVAEVSDYLRSRLERLVLSGLEFERLSVDPGIGFGKTLEHNLELLRRLDALLALGRPVVVGLSRKSFLGRLTGQEVNGRLAAGLAALSVCVANGANVMRVHDVRDSADAAKVAAALGRCPGGRP